MIIIRKPVYFILISNRRFEMSAHNIITFIMCRYTIIFVIIRRINIASNRSALIMILFAVSEINVNTAKNKKISPSSLFD